MNAKQALRRLCVLQAMAGELKALRSHSHQVKETHFHTPSRRATTAVRMAAHLLRGFL